MLFQKGRALALVQLRVSNCPLLTQLKALRSVLLKQVWHYPRLNVPLTKGTSAAEGLERVLPNLNQPLKHTTSTLNWQK